MPPQPFACSLKLLKRGVEGRSEKKGRRRISQKREKRTMYQRRMRPETMPAHTQTKTNTWTDKCRPTTQHWVFGPPEFSCLLVLGSPYRMTSTAHQTWARERSSPVRRAGCLPARSLASVLHWLEHPVCSQPSIESFLLCQIPSCFSAGPQIYTGLSCPA